MKVIYNRENKSVEFSNMEEGTVFLYDGKPFMKVRGVTEDTMTEGWVYAIDLTCGELYDLVTMGEGNHRYIVVEATLTI